MNTSVEDFKLSLRVFKDNLRAYLSVVLFVIAGSLSVAIFGLATLGFVIIIREFNLNLTVDASLLIFLFISIIFLFVLLVVFVFSAFNATLYGLSYDIMSSGNLYTEFRNAFIHFRKHWLAYIIISIPMLFISMIYQYIPREQLGAYILYIFIDFLSIMFFTGLLTSVTAKGKFFYSFKESISLLRRDFRRISLTIGIYFLIFRTPYIIGVYIAKLGLTIDYIILILLMGNFILLLFASLIGSPILSILATRIYNTNF